MLYIPFLLTRGFLLLKENGVKVINLDSMGCKRMLGDFIARNPEIWNEDIGET